MNNGINLNDYFTFKDGKMKCEADWRDAAEYKNFREIDVPEGVKKISAYTFWFCRSLQQVNLPDTVSIIDNEAFIGCSSLKQIDIPDSVISIGWDSFRECTSLEQVNLSNSVERITNRTFFECSSLKQIDIPDSVIFIGDSAFAKCESLSVVSFSQNLKEMGRFAFGECHSLQEISIPKSLEVIGDESFKNCTSLKQIDIPDSVTVIGANAFNNCSSLEQVNLSNKIKKINVCVFYNCTSLKQIVIPDSVVLIEIGAFRNCTSLKQIDIPDSVISIEQDAFRKCESLSEVSLSKKLKKIGPSAFDGCRSLRRISIPKSVEWIGKDALHDTGIEQIIFHYDNYEEFLAFIKNSKKFIASLNIKDKKDIEKDGDRQLEVVLVGPQLTLLQRMNISRKFMGKNINLTFTQEDIIEEDKINNKTDEPDIQVILEQIESLCNTLPLESKEIIRHKIDTLLKQYEENKNSLKPQYGKEEETLSFGTSNIVLLKPQLMSELEIIKLNLATEKKLIDLLSELNSYKELLKQKINEIESDNNKTENIIKNILYLTQYLSDKEKQSTISLIQNYLDDTIKESSLGLTRVTQSDINLTIQDDIDPSMKLKINLTNLYDKIYSKVTKIKPYKVLLDELSSSSIPQNMPDGNSIVEVIQGIKYTLPLITNNNYKDELKEKFEEIFTKYQHIIESIINNSEMIDNEKYDRLEKELRKEIIPILELMNNYAYLDNFEVNKANKSNLMSQLLISMKFLSDDEFTYSNDEYKLQPITSSIIELKNRILNNVNDVSIKENMKQDALNVVQNALQELEASTINSLDEYNKMLRKILGDIVSVSLKIDSYLKDVEEYNRYVK